MYLSQQMRTVRSCRMAGDGISAGWGTDAGGRTGAVLSLIITALFAIFLALDVGQHKRGAGQ